MCRMKKIKSYASCHNVTCLNFRSTELYLLLEKKKLYFRGKGSVGRESVGKLLSRMWTMGLTQIIFPYLEIDTDDECS